MSVPGSFLLLLATAAGAVVVAGCVTESERGEAGRALRPAMPRMAGLPAATAVPPAEEAVGDAVARAAAAGDYARAGSELGHAADRRVQERVARTVSATLAATDPAAAIRFALALPSGLARSGAIEVAARGWSEREPAGAARGATEWEDADTAPVVRRAVADTLARGEVRREAEAVLAFPVGPARDELLGLLVAAWARRDADAAEAWVRTEVGEGLRGRLVATVGFEIAQTNPPRAIALAESLPPGRDRWLLVSAITQTWVATDAKAAYAWTNRLPAGEPRDAAVAGLDAGLGIAVTRRVVAAPDTAGGVARRSGGGLPVEAERLPGQAFAAWRANQPAGLSDAEAVLLYVRQQGAVEPAVVGQWLDTLPGGSLREQAREAYWETLVVVAPAEAARWLHAQPRSDLTPEMIERTAREWLRTNPEAAAAWLRAQPLAPDRIEWLLREGGRR